MAEMNAGALLVILQRVGVGPALVRTRDRIQQRLDSETHPTGRDQEHRNTGRVGRSLQSEVRNGPSQHLMRGEKPGERQSHVVDDGRPDVLVHVMRQLVRKNHFDLVV